MKIYHKGTANARTANDLIVVVSNRGRKDKRLTTYKPIFDNTIVIIK